MMKAMSYKKSFLIVTALLLLFSCDADKNPTSDVSHYGIDISLNWLGSIIDESQVIHLHIQGSGIDQEYTTNKTAGLITGIQIPDIPRGKYQLKPVLENYVFVPDSLCVSVPDCRSAQFWGIPAGTYHALQRINCFIVFGAVLNDAGEPVAGVVITLKNNDSGNEMKAVSDDRGHFSINATRESGQYTVTPSKAHYQYAFTPPQASFPSPETLALCNFTARNTGAALHPVQGRVVDASGKGAIVDMRLYGFGETLRTRTDSLGTFRFSGLSDGDYSLTYYSEFYHLNPDSLRVTIKGADVILPDFIAAYIGPTWYKITGRVISRTGEGVPDVRMHIIDTSGNDFTQRTDMEGKYVYEDNYSLTSDSQGRITSIFPEKDGFAFSPEKSSLNLSRQEGIRRVTLTIPDFIGADFSLSTPDGYFPLRPGVSRTYARTVNSGTAADFTVSITGPSMNNGYSYFQFRPAGPAGFEYFRIDGNSVRAMYANKDVELFRFGTAPGTNWEVSRVSGGYPVTGTFLGLETVTVPAGTYPECLKYEVRTTYGETSHVTYTLWFAKDTGMVKPEKTLVNYGAVTEKVVDELK